LDGGGCKDCKYFPHQCVGDFRLSVRQPCALLAEKTAAKKEKARKRNLAKAKKRRVKQKAAKERVAAKERKARQKKGAKEREAAKAMAALEARWAKEKKGKAILAAWNAGEPVYGTDWDTLRHLIRAGGSVPPTGEELVNYPFFAESLPRSDIEAAIERATHRPFGRRAVYTYSVRDDPAGWKKFYRAKGHYGDLITFLEAALQEERGNYVNVAWTKRIFAAWGEITRKIKYEALSDEDRAEVDRKKAKHEVDMLEINAELARMLGY
jgi:hypothetical protein